MKISVVGTGYVGLVTGACFADAGHDVLCIDNDPKKIKMLHNGFMPIYEPGLDAIVERNVKLGRLKFSTCIKEGTEFAPVIFIAVGTPPGVGGEANMTYVEQVGRQVAENMTEYRLLVEKSTVPAQTSEYLKRTVLKYLRADTDFDVASNPEFLREGTAIEDATHPDRIVVGVDSDRAADLLEEIYRPILEKGGGAFLRMSVTSAELAKHASNSFLAMKISYINAVARICELAGADVEQVAKGMGLDPRIGPRFLNAGVGYGGSCFPKDVDAFVRLADALGCEFTLLKEVQNINKSQREYVMKKIKQELWVVQDKKVAIFGLAFKPETDDVREAPSLYFVPKLQEMKAKLTAWDPVAESKFKEIHPDLDCVQDLYECAKDADLLLILTEWSEVKNMDLQKLKNVMASPVIVDGRNIFHPEEIRSLGFTYHSVGRN
ncbi:MAG: UDP-glucose/GDP-mannose dehydrogenase family protein [Verrucomicrobiota bacterium]|jgi:UDPglucose 6-dehydrogenase|nr:UDP-glucose/GDP-mannose dehydrogenase family protein [Verrucomicrobiota bacterium]